MTAILIIDDDAFVRSGISLYLKSLGHTITEANNAQTGWEMALQNLPDAAIIDVRLPLNDNHNGLTIEPHGISLALRLKKSFPSLPIVMLSAHHQYEREIIQLTERHLRSIAFLHKGGEMTRLYATLTEVQAGRTVFSSSIANKHIVETAVRSQFSDSERPYINQALAEFPSLTEREQEVAHLIAASHTPQSASAKLHLTKSTVENRISDVYRKLGLTDMKQGNPNLRPLPILVKTCLLYDINRCK